MTEYTCSDKYLMICLKGAAKQMAALTRLDVYHTLNKDEQRCISETLKMLNSSINRRLAKQGIRHRQYARRTPLVECSPSKREAQ